jgi:hypothetical protein
MYNELAASEPVQQIGITFVDAANFNNLQSQHFKMAEFPELIWGGARQDALSVMTHAYLVELNNYLSELVVGNIQISTHVPLSEREKEYTRFAVQDDMKGECCVPLGDTQKLSYDTLPIDGQTLIVVVQKGFLNHLADSKDNYRAFVLACIRCMDRFNCDLSQLNQLYLRLQLTSAPYELMRCRIQ